MRNWLTGVDDSAGTQPPAGPANNGQIDKPTAQRQDVVDWFQTILHRDPTDQEVQKYVGGDTSVLMQDLRKMQPAVSGPAPTATPTPSPSPSGTGGPGTGLLAPFSESFTPPTPTDLPTPAPVTGAPTPDLPTWATPAAFTPTQFKAPSVEEAMNDPGYQFGVKQGQNSLQNWAAAKGTLNDSSTGKALTDYGLNAATQQYGNVWNRDYSANQLQNQNALSAYMTNYETQTVDPYTHAYQAAMDRNAPAMATWNANNAVNLAKYTVGAPLAQNANQFGYSAAFNKWLADWQMHMDQRDSTFNKNLAVASV